MTTVRAFIAIDLPEILQERLRALDSKLRPQFEGLPIHWVPVKDIHLTLKFLGDVSQDNLESITEVLHSECATAAPFEVHVEGLGLFPNAQRPRVIWVGVSGGEPMLSLQERLETGVAQLGYPPERRPFSPHLTLGRIQRKADARQKKQVADIIAQHEVGLLGTAVVDEVALFKSELNPDGAVYTKLAVARLNP
jgi:2'-5' RNA ligase